jgi:hypothetical protein
MRARKRTNNNGKRGLDGRVPVVVVLAEVNDDETKGDQGVEDVERVGDEVWKERGSVSISMCFIRPTKSKGGWTH